MHITLSVGIGTWLVLLATTLLPYNALNVELTKKNTLAPDFTLSDLDGNSHQLSQYKGQLVVLEWMNFRCRAGDRLYKAGTIPGIQKMYKDEVVWLSITSGVPDKRGGAVTIPQLVRQVEKRGGAQDAVLFDESGLIGQLYGVKTMPYFVIVSPDGVIIYEGAFDNMPDPSVEPEEGAVNYIQTGLEEAKLGKQISISTTEPYGCEVKRNP